MNAHAKTILILLLCFVPSIAFANTGTPLMWAGFLHLAFGNALIGIGEGLLMAFCFRLPRGRTVGLMVLANYFSAWVGYWVLKRLAGAEVARFLGDQPLYNAPSLLWLIGTLSFVLTVAMELPFCLAALWRSKNRWIRAVLASLLAQTASYAVLVPYYLKVSPVTIYTQFRLDPSLAFAKNKNAWIYFIGIEDGNVHRIRTDGTERQLFMKTRLKNQYDRLYVEASKKAGHLDLWLATPASPPRYPNTEHILMQGVSYKPIEFRKRHP